eukprot:scaffold6927_cov93-Cylindrotheca_fusiformis.AAC.9
MHLLIFHTSSQIRQGQQESKGKTKSAGCIWQRIIQALEVAGMSGDTSIGLLPPFRSCNYDSGFSGHNWRLEKMQFLKFVTYRLISGQDISEAIQPADSQQGKQSLEENSIALR